MSSCVWRWTVNADFLLSYPGPWFNIKMSSYQYRKSYCGDKTILRPSYLHNGISYTGKTISLYWIGALRAVPPLDPVFLFQVAGPRQCSVIPPVANCCPGTVSMDCWIQGMGHGFSDNNWYIFHNHIHVKVCTVIYKDLCTIKDEFEKQCFAKFYNFFIIFFSHWHLLSQNFYTKNPQCFWNESIKFGCFSSNTLVCV